MAMATATATATAKATAKAPSVGDAASDGDGDDAPLYGPGPAGASVPLSMRGSSTADHVFVSLGVGEADAEAMAEAEDEARQADALGTSRFNLSDVRPHALDRLLPPAVAELARTPPASVFDRMSRGRRLWEARTVAFWLLSIAVVLTAVIVRNAAVGTATTVVSVFVLPLAVVLPLVVLRVYGAKPASHLICFFAVLSVANFVVAVGLGCVPSSLVGLLMTNALALSLELGWATPIASLLVLALEFVFDQWDVERLSPDRS